MYTYRNYDLCSTLQVWNPGDTFCVFVQVVNESKEWCEMISECHLFEFVDLIEDETIEMGQCTLRVRDVDIVETESTGVG